MVRRPAKTESLADFSKVNSPLKKGGNLQQITSLPFAVRSFGGTTMNTMKHLSACAVAITAGVFCRLRRGGGGGAPLAGDGGRTPQEPSQRTPARPAITAGAYAVGELQASGETYSGVKLDQPLVTRFERDGSGGFDITYKIDRVDRTVSFDANGYDQSLDRYATAMGNRLYEVTFDPGARPGK